VNTLIVGASCPYDAAVSSVQQRDDIEHVVSLDCNVLEQAMKALEVEVDTTC